MEKSYNPIVITSKKATKDLLKIKGFHTDILTGMQNQSEKVKEYNEKMALEATEKELKSQEATKIQNESNQKQAELDIKRAALSM